MFPIWFFECYLTFTVLLFAFGPWPWPVRNPIKLYGFLVLVQIALWLGYKRGIKYNCKTGCKSRWNVDKWILISLVLNMVWIVPNFTSRMGQQSFSYGAIYEAILIGLTDPGRMYLSKIEALQSIEETSTLGYISIIISPVLWILLPLSVVFWERMKNWMRIGTIVWIAADTLSWVASGTNKGIADFVLLIPWLLIVRNPRLLTQLHFHRRAKLASIGIVLLAVLIIFFTVGQHGRGARTATELYDAAVGMSVDTENTVIEFLPMVAQSAYAGLSNYVVQGYYALSLSLEEPFIWTYGLGNSYFLTGLSRRFLGPTTISDMTYPARIEKHGWSRFGRWHSFYTWIACDVTFPGVILVVFFIGWLFANVWLDVLRKDNPIALPLFALLILMLFYFPANNQILAFSNSATAFCFFLFLWLRNRQRSVATKMR